MNEDKTNNAILEQLVYLDNFMQNQDEPNDEVNPHNFDLSAFADDEFVFADEDKPNNNKIDELIENNNLNNLPKFPVPEGAKNSLVKAGLNQGQIDMLSALIAQYQSVQNSDQNDGSFIPQEIEKVVSNDAIDPIISGSNREVRLGLEPLSNQGTEQNQPTSTSTSTSTPNPQPIRQNNDTTSSEFASGFQEPNSRITLFLNPQGDNSGFINGDRETLLLLLMSMVAPITSSGDDNLMPEINEVDKKRRNTAASARFRIKKKLKEKQMEDKINELEGVINNFEGKIHQLETENKVLKSLIIEKGSERSDQELKSLKQRILHEK